MPFDRFYLDAPFKIEDEFYLDEKETHHLSKVMRVSEDDIVEIVNGRNQLAKARVISIKKDKALLLILSLEEKKPPFSIILCQAIPRLNRLETIVEKGVELGMEALWLFPGKLSEKKELSENALNRLHAISIAAMKQCGRLDLPPIILKPPLFEWKKIEGLSYFGDVSKDAPLFSSVWKKEKRMFFFVGPESGFSLDEETQLKKLGVKGVKLHFNILRTDTAPIVALSLIAHKMMES